MENKIIKLCKECQNINTIEISEREAAFDELRSSKSIHYKCIKCNSASFSTISYPKINFYNKLIFNEWGTNQDLHFLDQDEAIFLAELDNLDNIIFGIESDLFLESKKLILLETLCILLYDLTYPSDEFSIEEDEIRKNNSQIVLPELIKRKEQILKLGKNKGFISDYVIKVVLPQLKSK